MAIQLAQRRKCELDSTREYTMVNWQQCKDEVILTTKKRIVNCFHQMLKDLYPSASSFSTSILVKVDMLDVIIYALLRILCYWSLLPHSYFQPAVHLWDTSICNPYLPAHPLMGDGTLLGDVGRAQWTKSKTHRHIDTYRSLVIIFTNSFYVPTSYSKIIFFAISLITSFTALFQ